MKGKKRNANTAYRRAFKRGVRVGMRRRGRSQSLRDDLVYRTLRGFRPNPRGSVQR